MGSYQEMAGWCRSRSRLMSMIGKVKGRSFEEVRVRSVQSLTSFGERLGLFGGASLPDDAAFLSEFRAPLRSAEALLDSFCSASTPVIGLRDIAATAAALPQSSLPQTIADADVILHNRFSLFGGQEFDFGNPVELAPGTARRPRGPAAPLEPNRFPRPLGRGR